MRSMTNNRKPVALSRLWFALSLVFFVLMTVVPGSAVAVTVPSTPTNTSPGSTSSPGPTPVKNNEKSTALSVEFKGGLFSIKAKKTPLGEILSEVEKRSGFSIFIEPGLKSRPVSLKFKDLNIYRTLDSIKSAAGLGGYGTSYKSATAPGKTGQWVVNKIAFADRGGVISVPENLVPQDDRQDKKIAKEASEKKKLMEKEPFFDKRLDRYVEVVKGEVLVRFPKGTPKEQIEKFHKEKGTQAIKDYEKVNAARLKIPATESVSEFIEKHSIDGKQAYIEPVFLTSQQAVQVNDPSFIHQWSIPQIQADKAWEINNGSPDVIVAVIDTGIDIAHLDLKNKVVQGIDIVNGNSNGLDDNGHGTHVAGVIAAEVNNSIGIAGISWKSKLMSVKVITASGEGTYSDLIEGVIYAVDHGARVLNLSLGGYSYSQILGDAIEYAHSNKAVIVAAGGNENTSEPLYPAAYPNIIGVSATDPSDLRWSSSNFGSYVKLSAPGVGVLSTQKDNGYGKATGSSVATAHVSGVAALILSKNPDFSNTQVENIFYQTADDLGDKGWDSYYGFGRVNALKAIEKAGIEVHDVAITGIRIEPETFKKGEATKIVVTVENQGTFVERNLLVRFLIDKDIIEKFILEIYPNEKTEVSFVWVPKKEVIISLEVTLPQDKAIADNSMVRKINYSEKKEVVTIKFAVATHRWVTNQAVEFLSGREDAQIYNELSLYLSYLKNGAEHEDCALTEMYTSICNLSGSDVKFRYFRHFYRPVDGKGYYDNIFGNQYENSYEWGYNNPINSYDWQDAIQLYKSGQISKAYFALGHVLHLLEDASLPEHTQLEAHTGAHILNTNGYEEYVKNKTYSDTSADLPLPPPGSTIITYDNLKSYFVELAKLSYYRNRFQGTLQANPINGTEGKGELKLMFPSIRYISVWYQAPRWEIIDENSSLIRMGWNPPYDFLTDSWWETKEFDNNWNEKAGFYYIEKSNDVRPAQDKGSYVGGSWNQNVVDGTADVYRKTDGKKTLAELMAEDLIPLAIRHVAGAIQLFWNETHGIPEVTSDLRIISPRANPSIYYKGETLTFAFTLKNKGGQPLILKTLTAGGRLNDVQDCSNTGYVCSDSTHRTNITIAPGDSYIYSGTFVPSQTGNYNFFVALEQETWKSAPAASGVTNVFSIVVNSTPVVSQNQYDAAGFISDITYPDGTTVSSGQSFIKTWRIKNTGTTTWNSGYRLVFSSGAQMNGPASVAFPQNVSPNGTLDISVNLTAPSTPGTYTGYWALQNQSGTNFGFKPDVQIAVPNQVTNTVTTPVDGNLIRATGMDRIYLVKGGRKWWISSPAVFTAMGYQWAGVKDYPSSVIDSIPDGPVIVVDGSLIRQQGDTKVFLIQNNQRRWITSEAAFVAGGYSWNNVIDVPVAIINMFPLGADITEKPKVLLASPNGGEHFLAGNSVSIIWSASDDVGISTVGIYYSTDGATWNTVATGVANSGYYAWAPNNFTAPSVKVKVFAYDTSAASGEDASDNAFSISAVSTYVDLSFSSITLGSSNLSAGQQVNVNTVVANQGNAASNPTNLVYYYSASPLGRDVYLGSSNVPSVSAGGTQTVNGSVTMPSLAVLQGYIVAVVNPNVTVPESTTGNNSIGALFSVTDTAPPVISYLSLGSNTFFKTGQKYIIGFTATDDIGVQSTGFYYSTDATNWTTITSYFIPGSNGYSNGYEWTIPTTLTTPGNLYIKMFARDASGNNVEKITGPYTLKDGTAPGVTILYPNGGDVWDLGSTQTIKWSVNAPNGVSGLSLYIYWGNTAAYIANVTNSNGSYTWTVPNYSGYATTGARIKLKLDDLNGNTNEDWSDAYFTINDASAPPSAPWTDPQVITAVPTDNQPYTSKGDGAPVIATDSAGNVHMVYMYNQDDRSGLMNNTSPARVITQKVLYKKLSNGTWTVPQTVYSVTQNTDSNLNGYYSIEDMQISVDTSGYPHIVWANAFGNQITNWNQNDIFYTKFNGTSWNTPINLSDNMPGSQTLSTLTWNAKASLPNIMSEAASAVYNGKLYVFGVSSFLVNYVYDPSTNGWSRIADSPYNGARDGGAAVVNNKIYVAGDPISNKQLKIYNPSTDSWATGPDMPTPRRAPSVAAVNGKVYVIGGWTSAPKNEMYDPATNTWTTMADMPTPRGLAAVAVVNDIIYVIGGRGCVSDICNQVEAYDPTTNSWTAKSNMPTTRSSIIGTVVNNKIYVIGGFNGSALNTVEEYDPATNNWLTKTSMPTARYGMVAGAIGPKIYVAGGNNGTSNLSVTEEATVADGGSGFVSEQPRIAIDQSNNVHVLWLDGYSWNSDYTRTGQRNIYYKKKDSLGNWSGASLLTNGSGPSYPSLTSDSIGKLHLVYTFGSNQMAYMQWSGASWSSPVTISTTSYGMEDVALDKNNNPQVVWYYYDAAESKQKILYSRFDGSSWSAPESVAETNQVPFKPSIAVDSVGRPHIVYEDSSTNKLIYRFKDTGGWSASVQVNKTTQAVGQRSSNLAISTNDILNAVWVSALNNSSEVFYNYANVSGNIKDITAPVVAVTSPSVGKLLSIGSTATIGWTASDNVGVTDVTLEYTVDKGVTYVPIATNIANSGTYQWTVPSVNSAEVKVRITALDLAGNKASGLSGAFSISDKTPPSVFVSLPNGGESLTAGVTYDITWSATDNVTVSAIDIYASFDNGASWKPVAQGFSNTGSYTWTVTNEPTSAALVKVVAKDASGNLTDDRSDWKFSIVSGNRPPNIPVEVSPKNNASAVGLNGSLSWTGGDPDVGDTIAYDVFFGATTTPPLVSSGQTGTSYNPGVLSPAQIYYWRVITKDNKGASALGPIWSFVTEQPQNQPAIALDIRSIVFIVDEGGANPAGQVIQISNTNAGAFNWMVSSGAAWLSLSPVSGTNLGTVNLTANVSGLAAGAYSTTISVTAAGMANSPLDIPVTLIVNKPVADGVSTPYNDKGIAGVERDDGGDDSTNIDSSTGKPKLDLTYDFAIVLKDPSGKQPQYVRLYITQRSAPMATDFYLVDLACTGFWDAGAVCSYPTLLGPAANHKYYFEVKLADGTVLRQPAVGEIAGPVAELLTGYNMAGVPRDVDGANLDGAAAFGNSLTYKWNSAGLTTDGNKGGYTLVDASNPVKLGEGYFTAKGTGATTLPDLALYTDVLAANYSITLSPGWNMVSNPYGGNVKLSAIQVQKGADAPATWAAATASNWIVNAIYYYKGSDWGSTYNPESAGGIPDATLAPWIGYWVYLNKNDAAYKLIITRP